MRNNKYRRPVTVRLPCIGTFIDENKVEFINIEEGFDGRDVMTFKCPNCGENHQSNRFG